MALESLTRLAPDEDRGRSVDYALSQLQLTASSVLLLLTIAEYDTSLGGTAAGLVWSIADDRKEWILDLLVDIRHGFNFLTSIARVIKKKVDLRHALALVERVSRLHVQDDVAASLMRGDDVHEYLGVISAAGDVLRSVPSEALIRSFQQNPSVLGELIVCEGLDHSRTPETLEFVQKCIIKGHDHAIIRLYFQLCFGIPAEPELPMPLPEVLETLLSAIREGRKARWALGSIQIFASAIPELRSRVATLMREEEGVMSALFAYAAGDDDVFFEILERVNRSSAAWATQAGAIEALGNVEVSWNGHGALLVELLRNKDIGLASSLFSSVRRHAGIGEDWGVACTLNDLAWWIEWLEQVKSDYAFSSRLGEFLASGTDQATRTSIVARFNSIRSERRILDFYVLSSMAGLSLDSFEPDAVEWLVGQLNVRPYNSWHSPLIGKIASENFVQERLLPLLLEDPPEPLRGNLLLSLREAGWFHRRRYIGDSDQILG